jgi:colanic acid biosynthesis glycosyl transferase WcaI
MPSPRILFIVNVFTPDQCGGAVLFQDLAQGLAEEGCDVTVRCAYSYYPEWKDKSGQNGWKIRTEQETPYRLERYGLYIPTNPQSLLQRLCYEGSFLLSLLRSLFKGKFDVVMVVCPLMGAVAFGTCMKWFRGTPIWLNVQDLSADAAAASGITKGKSSQKWLERIQNFLFNQADVWNSVSPVMVNRLKSIRTKNQPVLYLPNWLHDSVEQQLSTLPSKVGRALNSPIQLFYSGNIGSKQDLLKFCQYLHASDVPFEFRIHGSGGEADSIRKWVDQIKDARFIFGDLLPEETYIETLVASDLFVITEKSGIGGSFIPSKMIPSIATGTPILAISDKSSPFGQEMQISEAGAWFSWDQLSDVPRLLASLSEQPEKLVEWQENALNRTDFFRRKVVLKRYEDGLRALAEHNLDYFKDEKAEQKYIPDGKKEHSR